MTADHGWVIARTTSTELPGGVKQIVEERFAPPVKREPYRRPDYIRKHKPVIPLELRGQYESVEAAMLSHLTIDSENQTGDYPLAYGTLGGEDTPLDALNALVRANISEEKIVQEFMRGRAAAEFQKDESAMARVKAALRAIYAANAVPSR